MCDHPTVLHKRLFRATATANEPTNQLTKGGDLREAVLTNRYLKPQQVIALMLTTSPHTKHIKLLLRLSLRAYFGWKPFW